MTAFFVMSGIGQALSGFVVDRIGADKVLFAGLALLGFSALWMSQSQTFSMLMIGSTLAGLGNSVFHPADLTLLNKKVSPPRLAHAFSSHGVSGNLGWAAAPVFMTTIAGLYDWRVALVAAAVLPFAILAVLLAYRAQLRVDVPQADAQVMRVEPGKSAEMAFLRQPAVWLCIAFFFISAMAGTGMQGFAVPSLRELYGVSLAWATTCFTVYMLGSACGMVVGGFLGARSTRHERTIAMAFTLAGATAILTSTAIVPASLVVVMMAVIGFGAGVAGPSRDLLIRAAAPKNATGRVFGVVYSGLDVGMAVAPLIFGAIMDVGRPSWVFIGVGCLFLSALLTAFQVGSNNARKAAEVQTA